MGTVLLAEPRAFCAGVARAVKTVERALELHGAPVYVRKQIVHNRHVVQRLEQAGAVFVEEADEVPEGALMILSAHGVAPAVHEQAAARGLRTVDATCPLVTKVHREAKRFADEGFDILLIGQTGHEEVIGTMGQAPGRVHLVGGAGDVGSVTVTDPAKVAWLAQTTLTVHETEQTAALLRQRFPLLQDPPSDDICYAAQNRQAAVRQVAAEADLVLVVGSANSHNSHCLVDVARSCGSSAHLIDDAHGIQEEWLAGVQVIGVSAGASAPEDCVDGVVARLALLGFGDVRTVAVTEENQHFALPRELKAG
ncbi:4-hydroxy-3-methylbut-2-enyl diphosphate reductase [Kitasatospora sp. NE20-6]|uniref:4-hydroxy-3-methylbut-2-enyl diphosphate reductase n=1 Tax=Kitasatospora sp. NE20-6 TaxID=2859066 RepID=UPI0034DC1E55